VEGAALQLQLLALQLLALQLLAVGSFSSWLS
jgi:hypothetical protein